MSRPGQVFGCPHSLRAAPVHTWKLERGHVPALERLWGEPGLAVDVSCSQARAQLELCILCAAPKDCQALGRYQTASLAAVIDAN